MFLQEHASAFTSFFPVRTWFQDVLQESLHIWDAYICITIKYKKYSKI